MHDISALLADGRQIHATENGTDWKQSTYLYEDDGKGFFFFEHISPAGHFFVNINRDELKEYVAKLLPVLFTAEEMKKLLSGEGSPPVSAPPKPMS